MKKKITIHDLAKILNIDSSTVSRALADSPRVKLKTRDLIQQKAKELGYARNVVASNLRSKRTKTIGVIVPYISRYFFSTVISGIEEYASANGYRVIICQSHDNLSREEELIQTLMSYQVDGILISISMESTTTSHLINAIDQEVPLVLFDRKNSKLPLTTIRIDDYQRAYEATSHLIEQGCQCIAHFTGSAEISIYKERRQGYVDALKNFDKKLDERLILESPLKESDGVLLANQLLQMNPRPDAVFCANDLTAMAAIRHLSDQNIKVPQEMAFIGFSNEPLGNYLSPSLSTVNQNPKEIGKIAIQSLLEQLSTGKTKHEDVIVPSSLIIRQSSNKKESAKYSNDQRLF